MTVYSFATGEPLEPERNARGRRKGAHGNRVPEATKQRVLQVLWSEAHPGTGRLTGRVVRNCALMADCSTETIYAIWREARAASTTHVTASTDSATSAVKPSPLLRAVARANGEKRLTLTTAEIAWIAQFPFRYLAYEAACGDDSNRLGRYSLRSFYRACDQVHPSTWPGLGVGPGNSEKAARAAEAHPYRASCGTVSQAMCLDQYQVKGRIAMPNGDVVDSVQILPVTWEASGLVPAYDVLTTRGRVEDARRVIGEAVRGFTYDGFSVEGAGLFMRTDQAGEYLDEGLARDTRHVGMGMNPGESHSPRGNGHAENVFSVLDPMLRLIPGTTQWVTDRSGARHFTGELAWDTLLQVIDAAFHAFRFEAQFTQGEWKGWTRFGKHRELVTRGELTPRVPSAQELSHLAVEVACHQYNPTKGIWFRGDYYVSRELASNAKRNSHRLKDTRILTLVDESQIFLTDKQGVFLGTAVPRKEQEDLDKADLLADRGTRTGIRTRIIKNITAAQIAAGQDSVRNQEARYAAGGTGVGAPEPTTVASEDATASTPTPASPARPSSTSKHGAGSNGARTSSRKPAKSRASRGRTSAATPIPLSEFVAAFGDGLDGVNADLEGASPEPAPPDPGSNDPAAPNAQENEQ